MAIDQQQLTANLIFSGRATLAELTGGLALVRELDRKLREEVRLVRWLALAGFFGPVGLFLSLDWPLGAGIFLGLFGALGILIYSVFLSKSGIAPERMEFLRLTLDTLARDASAKSRFRVMASLRTRKEKIAEQPHPNRPKGKEMLYRDAWFTLSGRLGDGTVVSESCTDLIRDRHTRSSSGKAKVKSRRSTVVSMRLAFDPGRYGNASALAQAVADPFRVPPGARAKMFLAKDNQFSMKSVVKANPDGAAIHAVSEAMLLGAFRILNAAHRRVVAKGVAR